MCGPFAANLELDDDVEDTNTPVSPIPEPLDEPSDAELQAAAESLGVRALTL